MKNSLSMNNVLSVLPRAVCKRYGNKSEGHYFIVWRSEPNLSGYRNTIGTGITAREAWVEASNNVTRNRKKWYELEKQTGKE